MLHTSILRILWLFISGERLHTYPSCNWYLMLTHLITVTVILGTLCCTMSSCISSKSQCCSRELLGNTTDDHTAVVRSMHLTDLSTASNLYTGYTQICDGRPTYTARAQTVFMRNAFTTRAVQFGDSHSVTPVSRRAKAAKSSVSQQRCRDGRECHIFMALQSI